MGKMGWSSLLILLVCQAAVNAQSSRCEVLLLACSLSDDDQYSAAVSATVSAQPPSETIAAIRDPASFVVPFIGTINGGHVFPG